MNSGIVLLDWNRLERANESYRKANCFPDKEWFFYEGHAEKDYEWGRLTCLNGNRAGDTWSSHKRPHEKGFNFVKENKVPDEILTALAVYRLTGKVEGGVDA